MNQTITSCPRQLSLFDDGDPVDQDYTTCGGITLRYYQKEAAENCFKLWSQGSPGVLIRAATGTGKTILASSIIDRWLSLSEDHNAIILVHERQLAYQFRQEAGDVLGIHVGMEMAGEFVTSTEMPRVTVASRATLLPRKKKGFDSPVSRIRKFNPDKKWLIVIDEVHRYLRNGLKSCKHIFDYFEQNPESKRLGITATPMRGDKKSLRSLCPDVGYDYPLYSLSKDLPSAVGDGYAVEYDQRFIIVKDVDWKNIKTVGNDFDDGDLANALQERRTMLAFIQPTLDIVGDRRTLIFSPTVAMAQRVAYAINEELGGRNIAISISGETPHDVRMSVYEQFENDQFQFLSVCGLCLAEGTMVLTDQGEVPIQNVTTDMKLWDGVEFVSHDGVLSKGLKPVIEYAGLIATRGHKVWTEDGWKTLSECRDTGEAIAVGGISGKPLLETAGCTRLSPIRRRWNGKRNVYDILNAGPRNRFTASGLIVSNCREGFNNPGIGAVAIFRPTKSKTLSEQMRGRGCRVLPGVVDGLDTPQDRLAAIAKSKKPKCIAAGQLVLTDHGLVPIEKVTTCMKVWDGVEYVSHCGIMSRGNQRVVEYAGLTATGDHYVKTKDGWRRMAECMEEGLALAVAEIEGQAIRESDGYFRGSDCHAQRKTICPNTVRLRSYKMAQIPRCSWRNGRLQVLPATGRVTHKQNTRHLARDCWQTVRKVMCRRWSSSPTAATKRLHFSVRPDGMRLRPQINEISPWPEKWKRWLSQVWESHWSSLMAIKAMLLSEGSVRQQEQSSVWKIWWPWYSIQVCVNANNGQVGDGQSWVMRWSTARPHRQRRTLRTRKSQVCDTCIKPIQYSPETTQRRASCVQDSTQGAVVLGQSSEEISEGWAHLERNLGSTEWGQRQEMQTKAPIQREAEVFDIINAGPRNRFTVSGIIVKNCVIVDLVGCTGMCDTATTAHVLAEGLEDEVIDLANRNALKKGGPVDMAQELKEAKEQVEEGRRRKAEEQAKMRARAARLAAIKGKVIYSSQNVSPGADPGRAAKVKIPKVMPFGKHKGVKIDRVPTSYLRWLLDQYWLKKGLRIAVTNEVEDRLTSKRRKPQRYGQARRPSGPPISNSYMDCPF